MLIFNHPHIESSKFVEINSIKDIDKTTPNDILLLKELKEPFSLAKYCATNSLAYAVNITQIKEALYASALNCSYIICNNLEFAKKVQNIANEYLWDSKILLTISNEKELEEAALNSIDGVIFQNSNKG